jgi:hypothetical protein
MKEHKENEWVMPRDLASSFCTISFSQRIEAFEKFHDY